MQLLNEPPLSPSFRVDSNEDSCSNPSKFRQCMHSKVVEDKDIIPGSAVISSSLVACAIETVRLTLVLYLAPALGLI